MGKDKLRYQCIEHNCTHTVPNRGYLMGKQAKCPECKKPFIIDNDVLRRVLLRCQVCIGTVNKPTTLNELTLLENRLKEALLNKAIEDTEVFL